LHCFGKFAGDRACNLCSIVKGATYVSDCADKLKENEKENARQDKIRSGLLFCTHKHNTYNDRDLYVLCKQKPKKPKDGWDFKYEYCVPCEACLKIRK